MSGKDAKHSNSGDVSLFEREVGDVRPLKTRARHAQRPQPRPVPRFTRERERAALAATLEEPDEFVSLETGEELSFRRDHVSTRVFRRLGAGRYRCEAEIDLHGLRSAEAHRKLRAFIMQAARDGLGSLRVIHGKGRGSGHGGPVLKSRLNGWLRKWDEVLAFRSARPADGGTGAVYVLLQNPSRRRR